MFNYHKIIILISMGVQTSVPAAARVSFPRPDLIETGDYTTKVSMEKYDANELVKNNLPEKELPEIKKILSDKTFQGQSPENFRTIHFHNKNCESILEVTNKGATYDKNVMAVQLSE